MNHELSASRQMKTPSKLIHFMWLVVVLVMFGATLPIVAAFSTTPISFGYDGRVQVSIAYDRTSLLVFDYDSAPVSLADEMVNRRTGTSGTFAKSAGFLAAEEVTTPIGELRAAGLQDAHHVIQDAAVRDLPGYDTQLAPGVQLEGPSTAVGTPHYLATQAQRAAGGGTYAAERDIAANSLRAAGYSEAQIQQALTEADNYFQSIGVNSTTPTRIPGNRRP